MRKILFLLALSLNVTICFAQNIGVGTTIPLSKLHILSADTGMLRIENSTTLATGVSNAIYFKTGSWFTGGIKHTGTGVNTSRTGFYGYASGVTSGLKEYMSITDAGLVGISTTTPDGKLEVNGNIIADSTVTANTNSSRYGFLHSDGTVTLGTYVGFKGGNLGGYIGTRSNHPLYFFTNDAAPSMTLNQGGKLLVNMINGYFGTQVNVDGGIGVISDASMWAVIGNNTSSLSSTVGVEGQATNGTYSNYGIKGFGGTASSGNNTGVYGYATGSAGSNYGVYGTCNTGAGNWAGYFQGAVFGTSYQTSDEKLKTDITDYKNALSALSRLKVKNYTYLKDGIYGRINLPEGPQVGIMAADIEAVFPQLIKAAVSRPLDEKTKSPSANEQVSFKAVNYTGLIPVLVKGMQEQQQEIDELKAEIAELKAMIKHS